MTDLERARAVKRTARDHLFRIPGVHTVGVGRKRVGGVMIDDIAIVVFVTKKKPIADLAPNDVVAATIDGVPTDVIESPPARLYGAAERPLKGGLKLHPSVFGEGGSLGFIGELADKSRIYAITCWHVVGLADGQGSDAQTVVSDLPNNGVGVTVKPANNNGAGIITPDRSIVQMHLGLRPTSGPKQDFYFVFLTPLGETNSTVESVITTLFQRVQAAAPTIKLGTNPAHPDPSNGQMTLAMVPPAGTKLEVSISISGRQKITKSDLHVDVSQNRLTFSGSVTDKYFGVYTTLYVDGLQHNTPGVYAPIAKGSSPADVVAKLSTELTKMNNQVQIPNFSLTPSGGSLTIGGVTAIESVVWPDVRIGEENNWYSSCCYSQVGAVAAGRRDLDVAVVQLDPELEYVAEIKDIGYVTGSVTNPVTIGTQVEKFGCVTSHTYGTVDMVDVDGYATVGDAENHFPYFALHHTNAVRIISSGPSQGNTFADPGDSGAAVVEVSGQAAQVAGILFGGHPTLNDGLMMPIQDILTALKVINISTASKLNDVRQVPMFASAERRPAPTAIPAGMTRQRLDAVREEVAKTKRGKEYIDILGRHAAEATRLINRNRRVGVTWQRNGGPVLVRAVLQAIHEPGRPIPPEIVGKPLDSCLDAIATALRAHGSSGLVEGLDRLLPALHDLGLAGASYPEVLTRLEGGDSRSSPQEMSHG
jgi:hypothetical protein